MSKKLKNPAAVIRGILANSDAYQAYQTAQERKVELGRERRELRSRIEDLKEADLDGVQLVSGSRGPLVELPGRPRIPLDQWRAKREEERRAVAVLDGEEVEPSTRDRALEEIARLVDRIDDIEAALPLADERIKEAENAAKAAVRDALRAAYSEQVAAPLKPVLEALMERAGRHAEFLNALTDSGLPTHLVQGLPLGLHGGRNPDGSPRMSVTAKAKNILAQIDDR